MNESEGRELAKLPKWGEPKEQWAQDRPNTFTNSFGVVDADGKQIKGVHVDLAVFISPRRGQPKFVFTLHKVEHGQPERAYQIEINAREGLRPTDHAYSHEHYGGDKAGRRAADQAWAFCGFERAVTLFCERCNLTLTGPLPHYEALSLK